MSRGIALADKSPSIPSYCQTIPSMPSKVLCLWDTSNSIHKSTQIFGRREAATGKHIDPGSTTGIARLPWKKGTMDIKKEPWT